MLEVRDLRKIYKTKNGTDVHALDGVSLRFAETGMVFLLGKSGSGKSTLLNVCGGLDSPSDGEIIVKGRSSKDFTQSDFDSYRNTFVGFIFQEYNILNEFSVEDNIALALELQGKPKDKAAIMRLLEDVDLQGFAKRKPNTLSGGQKQRIAIARALVKAPEIIMADEPTGALDSNTGKQVFETLKKLSRDKLVIVVSHDRDFAEQYGDRIIELKDGKVISDISKTQEEQQALTANVNAVGDVLCVKRGKDLTDADFDKIKAFLKRSEQDVIIANGETDVKNFKKISRINDDGSKEVFCDTVSPETKPYTKEDSRFIRSKLPIRHAVKIGVSGLRSKPFRLFFTVILCTVAFTLFGLLSTLNFYDSHATFVQTLQDTDTSVMQLEKEYKLYVTQYANGNKEYEYERSDQARFTEDDRKGFESSLSPDAFGTVSAMGNFNLRQTDSDYWVSEIAGFAVLPENNSLRGRISGTYPQEDDEIVISSYAANMLYACKAYDGNGNVLELSAPESIIGKTIVIGGFIYKVTGILDSGEIPSEYEVLKDTAASNASLVMQYTSFLGDGLHLLTFVTADHLKMLSDRSFAYIDGIDNYTDIASAMPVFGEYEFPEWSNARYGKASSWLSDKQYIALSSDKAFPGDEEAILSSTALAEKVSAICYKMAEAAGDDVAAMEKYYAVAMIADQVWMRGTYQENAETGKTELVPFSDAQLLNAVTQLVTAVKELKLDLTLGVKLFNQSSNTTMGDLAEFSIIGVYVENNTTNGSRVLLSDASFARLWEEQKHVIEFYSESESVYKESADAVYSKIYLPFEYSEATAEGYWDIYNDKNWSEDESRTYLTGNFVNNLRAVDDMVGQLSKVFLYLGIVLAAFAVLLFSNFIAASITQKKREIGILRAVGARSTDVFKIFFSESFVIAAVCVVLSTAASAVICDIINTLLAVEIGASLFVFGVASFVILVAVAMVTVVVATFLPVYHAAKKKPVDSIRSL